MLRAVTRSLRCGSPSIASICSSEVQRYLVGARPISICPNLCNQLPVRITSSTRSFSTHTKGESISNPPVDKDDTVASPDFKARWLMALPAFGTHMCIGAPFAWSLMADTLTRELGFVASAAADWSLYEAALPLSMVFVMQGLTAALFGKWQLRVGPRKALAAAATAFGGGMLVTAAGIHLHMLPLIYLGYGLLGGTGVGLGYTPPVQTLMQWFPDKKGIASGLTIAGFGSGALIFIPSVQFLMDKFRKLPEYLGPKSSFSTSIIDGKLFADVNGISVEVVEAFARDLAKLPVQLSEGLYVVGTGSTGAAEALAIMGAAYFSIMATASLAIRKPHPSFAPPVTTSLTASNPASGAASPASMIPDIPPDRVITVPQFHLLGVSFLCIATGGMGMLSVAKPMMSEVFSGLLPSLVTAQFASQYLLMLSAANLGGRLVWAGVSDAIGRRNTFHIFTLGSIPMYLLIPTIVDSVIQSSSSVPLAMFIGSTCFCVSVMGGTYAILPPYESDLFGTKFVGANHGRMLLYSSAAALAGPNILMYLRSMSEKTAINDLLSKVSPDAFMAAFGTPIERAQDLIASKTLTISKLLALAPQGTLDPTPHLYDSTMTAMSAFMAVAAISHLMVKPMTPSQIEKAIGQKKTVVDVSGVEKSPSK